MFPLSFFLSFFFLKIKFSNCFFSSIVGVANEEMHRILGNASHTSCCFENNSCNLCQADLASALTTSLHLLPNRQCSADRGLMVQHVYKWNQHTALTPVIMGPGESHLHMFHSIRTRITASPEKTNKRGKTCKERNGSTLFTHLRKLSPRR